MGPLLLYSTSGCHLCEEAQEVIRRAHRWVAPPIPYS
jgi:hypothetical protein